MFFRVFAASVLCLVLCATACSSSKPAESSRLRPAGKRPAAPDFALKDVHGQTVRLSDFKGKVVLLNFWATWCAPCKVEIPWFMDFEQKYKDRGLVVLGVSMDEEGWEVVKPFLDRMKINYRVVIGNDEVSQSYGGVDALPTTLLVDRNGMIASKHEGLAPKSEYEKEILGLLDAQ
jgi:cytochrome c biogenesis protein CcmG/thiol:disulfide interchange protein DsbE